MIDMKRLGENIRQMRKVKGLTQEELAEKSNLSTMSIRRYENGERTITEKALARIANALDVAMYEFFPEGEEIDTERFPWWPLRPPTVISGSSERSAEEIAADIIKRAGLTLKDSNGNIIIHGDGVRWRKLSEAEVHRAGILKFNSDEDRVAFFYDLLNTDGKLVASRRMFQSLDPARIKDVADYVQHLSEIPQYQRPATPQSPPDPQEGNDTAPDEKPPEDT